MATIDEQIVKLKMDNADFKSKVASSIDSLGTLKSSLNLDGATNSLQKLANTAKTVTFDKASESANTLQARFSTLSVAAGAAIGTLASRVTSAGMSMLKALTIDPILDGYHEYETQLNAVQTILANTKSKGENIQTVNDALNELNTYADKTIYNFSEMTHNIGMFTAAGVGLKDSVSSIKGIANLAALSGSNSQQASTAMYQLSQAISSGTVRLMDWNSVVNAGMGGEAFQEALKRTARAHGVAVDSMIQQEGSFRESLSKGWLSSQIMVETLSQLAGEYNKEQLISMGYTAEQADAIVDLAKTAEESATKIKTFSQLIGTVKEELGSGWAQTFSILFGNFEEAQDLFTTVGNAITGFVGQTSQARNAMLQTWKDMGGRTAVIEGLTNVVKALVAPLKAVGIAFQQSFNGNLGKTLADISIGFQHLTEKLVPSDKAMDNLTRTFKGLFSAIKIILWPVGQLLKLFAAIVKPILGAAFAITKFVLGGLLTLTAHIGDVIVKFDQWINGFDPIGKLLDWLGQKIRDLLGWLDKLTHGKFSMSKIFGDSGSSAIDKMDQGLSSLQTHMNGMDFSAVKKALNWIGDKAEAVGKKVKDALFRKGVDVGAQERHRVGEAPPGGFQLEARPVPNEAITSMQKFKNLLHDLKLMWTGDDATLWGRLSYTFTRVGQAARDTAAGGFMVAKAKLQDLWKTASRIRLDDFYNLLVGKEQKNALTDLIDQLGLNKLGPAFKNLAGPVKEFGLHIREVYGQDVHAAWETFKGQLSSIGVKMKDVGERVWDVCGPAVIAAWNALKRAAVYLGGAIKELAGSALTTVKDFFAGIDWAGIGEKIKHVADNIKDFAEGVKNGAHGDAGTMFVKLGDKAHEAAGKIKELGSAMGGKTAELFKKWGSDIKEGANAWGLPEKFEKIKKAVLDNRGKIGDALDWLGEKFKWLGDKIKEGIGKGYEALKGMNAWDALVSVISGIFTGIMAGSFVNLARSFSKVGSLFEELAKTVKSARGPIVDTINAYKDSMKATTHDLNATAILKLAAATLVLAVALAILALIPADRLMAAATALAVIFGVIIGAWFLFNRKAKTAKEDTENLMSGVKNGLLKNLENITGGLNNMFKDIGNSFKMAGLLAIAAGVLLLAGAVYLLSKLDTKELVKGIVAITVITAVMVTAAKVLEQGDNVAKGAGQFILMAAAMILFYFAVKGFGEMDATQLVKGILALVAIVGAMTLFSMSGDKLKIGNGLAILATAYSIKQIVDVIDELSKRDWNSYLKGFAMLSMVLAELMGLFLVMPDNGFGDAVAMLAMVIAIQGMCHIIGEFASMDWSTYLKGVIMMTIVIGELVAAVMLLKGGGAAEGAGALIAVSVAVMILAGALQVLGSMSLAEMGIALLGLAVGLGVLIAAAYLAQEVVVPMMLLAAAVALIGIAVGVAAAGIALFVFAFVALLTAVTTGGVALIALIPLLCTAIAQGFINICNIIGSNGPAIEAALTAIITACLNALRNSLPSFFDLVRDAIIGMCNTINQVAPVLIQTGINLIKDFLRAIRDNISEITQIAIDIIVNFIDTVSANLGRIIDSGVNLLLSFLDGIKTAIDQHADEIGDKAVAIGVALVNGIKRGIERIKNQLMDSIRGLADKLPQWLKEKLGIASPSKVTTEIGEFVGLGLVRGIDNSEKWVKRSSENLAESTGKSINEKFREIVDGLTLDPDFNPVITPTVDDSQVRSAASRLGDLFNSQSANARVSVGVNDAVRAQNGSTSSSNGVNAVTFNQTINSPTAPTRREIYRDTKELISNIKRYSR